jgi:hypothetical protein
MALVENFQPMPEGTAESLMLTSPTLGFGAGQTARLSVVNTTTASETNTLSIVNGLGVTIKTAPLLSGRANIGFIQTTTPNSRLEVHGTIDIDRPPPPPCCQPGGMSLQVFDSTTQETLARVENFSMASP